MILAVAMICFFTGCSVIEGKTFITSQNSPDGDYTISLYQIGSPQWSFGSVKARLVLEDSRGKTVDTEDFSLGNDGTGVAESNIAAITWAEDQVQVQMKEFDTTKQYTYILRYSE